MPASSASSSSSASSPLLYALGRYTPGFEVIFDHLPGVDLYRRPADATFLINIVLAFAAGYLVHRYVRDGLPRFEPAAHGPVPRIRCRCWPSAW